jgi:hypothetical protein
MQHLFRTAALGAVSIVALATPAFVALTIVITVGTTTEAFTTAGDSLDLPDMTIAGVAIAGEDASVIQGSLTSPDILDDWVLSVTNTTIGTPPVSIVISATGLTGPVSGYSAAGSGTWQNNTGQTITMNWYANGTQLVVPSYTNMATSALQGFGTTSSGPYSFGLTSVTMSESASYTLKAGGELLNRGINESLTVVPEPSTWAMLVVGFAGLGYAAFRRNAKSRAIAV